MNFLWRDQQILKEKCVRARAVQVRSIEILELLQVGHGSNRCDSA
jgi:hypothetical protein